jgi:ubiquinone biosynthesis protein
VARCFAELGQRRYVIPRPHPELVTRRVLVMERLRGFAFSDVAGMKDAGVDTEAVVRTGMIGFMEGALVQGIFHGDLHAGNLFVLPDGRTALMDFGITGRLDDRERHAFLRFMLGASMSDVTTQMTALRDLGALPPDTDIDAVIKDLGLDKPPLDPTQMSADDLVHEMQQMVKALLGLGARLPKELMLFVKNMVFCDAAIATLAPDIDLLGEVSAIAFQFATKHGEKLAAEIGFDFASWQLDTTSLRVGLGLDDATDTLTYRDLQQRRQLIRHRLEDHRATQRRGRRSRAALARLRRR